MPDLALFCAPRIELSGGPATTVRRKSLALLAYLAVPQQPHTRGALATRFWPDAPQNRARANLRNVLWDLDALPIEFAAEKETVALVHPKAIALDGGGNRKRSAVFKHGATFVPLEMVPANTLHALGFRLSPEEQARLAEHVGTWQLDSVVKHILASNTAG